MTTKEMQVKHTPAPWRINFEIVDNQWSVVTTKHYSVVAIINAGRHKEANARLIAAAPDLLSALQEVVKISDRDHNAWVKAKAAISKALGETA
jgi:hypothetical protein